MDEYDKQYPMDAAEAEEMYYYQQMQDAALDPAYAEEMAKMDP